MSYPEAEVRARSGYRELPDSELRARKVAAALALPGSVMGRPVPAAAFHRFEPDGAPKILLVVGLPRRAETISGTWAPAFEGVGPAADNREELVDVLGIPYFRVHAIALDRAGEVSGETHASLLPHTDLAGYAPDASFRYLRYTTVVVKFQEIGFRQSLTAGAEDRASLKVPAIELLGDSQLFIRCPMISAITITHA